MWTAYFVISVIASLGCAFYITVGLRKLIIVKKLAATHAVLGWIVPAAAVCAIMLALILTIEYINAFVCLVVFTVFRLLCDLVALIVKKVTGKTEPISITGIVAVALSAAYLITGWVLAHNVVATDYSLQTKKDIGHVRIVQFTDSHMGALFDANKFADYVAEMNAQNPDIVVITGDFVDESTSREDMFLACNALSAFDAPLGVFYVFGNHERYSDAERRGWSEEELRAALGSGGVTVLEDEVADVGSLYIIGRKDYYSETRAPIEEIVAGLDRSKYIVVLDHQPREYDAYAAAGADLVLSGHTHGGQLIPINLFILASNDRTYGYERRGNTDFIVSSGIADWEIKFKTGCISEYVVIDIN